jgi:heme/copper-type cytochrome/quinol oxidase subunit 2
VKKITARELLRAIPAHGAMGACFGLLTFLILVLTDNSNIKEMIASGSDPKQTFLMLAAVFVSMFAIFCGVTGLLFITSEPGGR